MNDDRHFNQSFQTDFSVEAALDFEHLAEKGRQQAILSGTDKQLPEHIKALTDYAEAYADSKCGQPYDPVNSTEDRFREDVFNQTIAELQDAHVAEGYAANSLLTEENEAAAIGPHHDRPEIISPLLYAAVVALLVSIAPTIHDKFFSTFPDQILAWFYSTLAGTPIAAFIVLTLISTAAISTQRTLRNWVGLIGGVGIGISLGLVRAADAQKFMEYLYAVGLTGLEIFGVILLEGISSKHRVALNEWKEHETLVEKAKQRVNIAQGKLGDRREHKRMLEGRKFQHISYVETKNVRHRKAAELKAAAVKIILNAYSEAVAENKGRLLGIVTKVRIA